MGSWPSLALLNGHTHLIPIGCPVQRRINVPTMTVRFTMIVPPGKIRSCISRGSEIFCVIALISPYISVRGKPRGDFELFNRSTAKLGVWVIFYNLIFVDLRFSSPCQASTSPCLLRFSLASRAWLKPRPTLQSMLALMDPATHHATATSPINGAPVFATATAMATAWSTAAVPHTSSISTAWLSPVGTRYDQSQLTKPSTRWPNPQVYSCEYQLFIQQYFSVCPSAVEPIPFWPAPDNAPNRCSCDLGKVLQNTLTARNEQVSCMKNVTDQTLSEASNGNLANLGNGLDIAKQATECACCGASASYSA